MMRGVRRLLAAPLPRLLGRQTAVRLCSGLAQRVPSEPGIPDPPQPLPPSLRSEAPKTTTPPETKAAVPDALATEATVGAKQRLQEAIKRSFSRERYEDVLSALGEAQRLGVSLDSEAYSLILSACVKLQPTPQVRQAADAAYDFFARSRAVPIEVIHRYLRHVSRCRFGLTLGRVVQFSLAAEDASLAMDAYRLYNRRYKNLRGGEKVLYPVVSLMARNTIRKTVVESRAERSHQFLGNLLVDLREMLAAGAPPPDELLFVELARAFSNLAQSENLLQTLIAMTAARFEPSLALCEELLENALWDSDRKVLAVLLGWFANNFVEYRLELGRINRILQISSFRGDESLARLGFKMLERSGRTPELVHYVCWTRACLYSANLNGAMEALLEAQVQGHDVLGSEFGPSLQAFIADALKVTYAMLDGIYFSLVDLRRGNYTVPPIVLNALIIAAGKLNQLDRAFGTFQEYESLFGHRPDVHAYNALMSAIANSRFPSASNQLAILEDLVEAGIQPNDESFSILLSTMAETGEMKVTGQCTGLILVEEALFVGI